MIFAFGCATLVACRARVNDDDDDDDDDGDDGREDIMI
jgi:hypothetical protein